MAIKAEEYHEPVHHAITDELTTCGIVWVINDDEGYAYTYGTKLVTCEDCLAKLNTHLTFKP